MINYLLFLAVEIIIKHGTKERLNMKKTMAELFAGVGGFRIGLDRLHSNWNCVYANQWEPSRKVQYAYECYKRHFGGTKAKDKYISNVDINKVSKNNIPDITLLTGGFPCQDYSVAHTHAKGIQGKKGVLWWAIKDTIKAKKPPFVLLENVNRLLSSPGKNHRGRDFGIILYTLWKLGYGVQWRMINSAWYGFPQRRRRVYIFAYRKDTNYFKVMNKKNLAKAFMSHSVYNAGLPIKPKFIRRGKKSYTDLKYKDDGSNSLNLFPTPPYKDMVEFSKYFTFHFWNTGIMMNGRVFSANYTPVFKGHHQTLSDIMLPKVTNPNLYPSEKELKQFAEFRRGKKIKRTAKDGHQYWFSMGSMPFPDPINRPSRTMLTSEHSLSRTTHIIRDKGTGKLRLLDPIECERLQGFPDNWTKGMPMSARCFMMGNALVTGIITKIGQGIDKIIKNEK